MPIIRVVDEIAHDHQSSKPVIFSVVSFGNFLKTPSGEVHEKPSKPGISNISSDQNKSIANGLGSWNYILFKSAGDAAANGDANMIGGIMRC